MGQPPERPYPRQAPAAPPGEIESATGLPELIEIDALIAEDDDAHQRMEREIHNGQIPHIGFGSIGFPLFAPTGENAWALLNLILCVVGAMYVVVTTMRVLLLKKRTLKEDKKKYCVAGDPTAIECPDENEEKQYRPGWLAAAAVMAIAGAYLFVLTENMRNPLVLIDGWTMVHAIIVTAQFIAVNVVFKSDKRDERDERDEKDIQEESCVSS